MSLMNYLVKLNLSSNLLTKVDGLSGLTRLIELNLSQNKMFVAIHHHSYSYDFIEMIFQASVPFINLKFLMFPQILFSRLSL